MAASQSLVESIVLPIGVVGFLYFIYWKNTRPEQTQTGGSHTRHNRNHGRKTRKH